MVDRRVTPSKPAFYARISLDRSGEAVGVKDQVEQGRKHLQQVLRWPEPEIYIDNDKSAMSGKARPAFEQLLQDVEAGVVDGIAARHFDRLLRHPRDLERLLDVVEGKDPVIPVSFVEAGDIDLWGSMGRAMARVLTAMATNESELKAERVKAARRREATAGRQHGPLGYGFDEHNNIVKNEADVVLELAERIISGDSLRSIAADLNARGVATPGAGRWDARRIAAMLKRGDRGDVAALIEAAESGVATTTGAFAKLLNRAGAAEQWTAARVRRSPWAVTVTTEHEQMDRPAVARMLREVGVPADDTTWRAANVRSMMRRGALCGWREFSPGKRGGAGELVAEGSWVPILTKETTLKIRELTDRPGARQRGRPPKYLLASILRCAQCGSSMGGGPDGNGGARYSCSKQPGRSTCGGATIAAAPVEAMITRTVLDFLIESDVRVGNKRTIMPTQSVAEAQQELLELDALEVAASRRLGRKEMTLEAWNALLDELNRRRSEANRVLGSYEPTVRRVLRGVPSKSSDIEGWWGRQEVAVRREVIKVLIDHVPIERAKGARRFDPARVQPPIWR